MGQPKVVLADEPTGNLDSKNGSVIMDLLKRLNKEIGQTFVVVSHDATFRHIADKTVYMRDGYIERIEQK